MDDVYYVTETWPNIHYWWACGHNL